MNTFLGSDIANDDGTGTTFIYGEKLEIKNSSIKTLK